LLPLFAIFNLFFLKFNAMKHTQLFILAIASMFIASCGSTQYASNGKSYENDDVYYQTDETYISDFAIVDDPEAVNMDTPAAESAPNATTSEDEYYEDAPDPQLANEEDETYNYYGNVYNYGYLSPGYSGYYAGYNNGWYNPWTPSMNVIWDPYRGWHINYGLNYGWGNYWNDPWGWNSPCYDPWSYNSWSWNSWNSPYGYYNPYGWNSPYCGYGNYWYNGYGNYNYYDYYNNNNNNGQANVTFGHRPSITVGSAINSAYTDGNLNSGRLQHKPLIQSDVVEEIDRIKDDYHAGLANGDNVGLVASDKNATTGYQTAVGSVKPAASQTKMPSIKHSDSPGNRPERDQTPASGVSTKPKYSDNPQQVDRPRTTNNRPEIQSKPERSSVPSTKPSSSPRPSNTPSGVDRKPASPPSSPSRKKTPGIAMAPNSNESSQDSNPRVESPRVESPRDRYTNATGQGNINRESTQNSTNRETNRKPVMEQPKVEAPRSQPKMDAPRSNAPKQPANTEKTKATPPAPSHKPSKR
jgi:hypothetical protein